MGDAVQNIGLMLTCNEEDIIEEVMTEYNKYFDRILVLDGSTDKTPDILRSFKSVVYLVKDEDVSPNAPIRDGARQFLVAEAQKRYGYEGFFTILHGDEVFHDDPNGVCMRAHEEGIELIRWLTLTFCFHVSERETFLKTRHLPAQEKLHWCFPHSIEYRQFINKKGVYFDVNKHETLAPYGADRLRGNKHFPVFKHYPFRVPDQMIKRAQDRCESGFCDYQWVLESADLFYENAPFPGNAKLRRFDDVIGSFELGDKPLVNVYGTLMEKVCTLFAQYKDHPNLDAFIDEFCLKAIHDSQRRRSFKEEMVAQLHAVSS